MFKNKFLLSLALAFSSKFSMQVKFLLSLALVIQLRILHQSVHETCTEPYLRARNEALAQ